MIFMGDAIAGLHEGFEARIAVLWEGWEDVLSYLTYEDGLRLGAEGADAAMAPIIWAAAVGERWPTSTVTVFLGITRQALHKRVVNGTVLGLPGRGTTWFPVWQFDPDAHEVRPVVAEVIAAFRDELGGIDPLLIASWAMTDQPELAMSPEQWLAAGKDPTEVARIAKRAAAELAQ